VQHAQGAPKQRISQRQQVTQQREQLAQQRQRDTLSRQSCRAPRSGSIACSSACSSCRRKKPAGAGQAQTARYRPQQSLLQREQLARKTRSSRSSRQLGVAPGRGATDRGRSRPVQAAARADDLPRAFPEQRRPRALKSRSAAPVERLGAAQCLAPPCATPRSCLGSARCFWPYVYFRYLRLHVSGPKAYDDAYWGLRLRRFDRHGCSGINGSPYSAYASIAPRRLRRARRRDRRVVAIARALGPKPAGAPAIVPQSGQEASPRGRSPRSQARLRPTSGATRIARSVEECGGTCGRRAPRTPAATPMRLTAHPVVCGR